MQWLQVFALLPMLLAGRLRRLERRAVARARDGGGGAERGVPLEPAGKLGDFVYRRLQRAGVLLPAGNDRYYFSAPAYAAYRARRRKRALMVVIALVIGVAILSYRGDLS